MPEQNTEIFDVCLKVRYPEPERSYRYPGMCGGNWSGVMDAVGFSAFVCQAGGLDPEASGALQQLPTSSEHLLRY